MIEWEERNKFKLKYLFLPVFFTDRLDVSQRARRKMVGVKYTHFYPPFEPMIE